LPGPISKTTAIFAEPFRLPGLDEVLPAGAYELETEINAPFEHLDPDRWKASVMVRLHPRQSHPGLDRTMTVPLEALEQALARDLGTGHPVFDSFVEDMLSDPIVRLVMAADGVSEAEIRRLHAHSVCTGAVGANPQHMANEIPLLPDRQDEAAIQRAENEGMRPRRATAPATGTAWIRKA
jgi:hypothetical protein